MFRQAWIGIRGRFARAPGASIFIRTTRMTRDSPWAQFYKARQGPAMRAPGKRPYNSKLLASSFGAVMIIPLSLLVSESNFSTLIDLYTDNIKRMRKSESEETINKFWSAGRFALGKVLNSEVVDHGSIPMLEGAEGRIISVPDPYNPEKRFVVYQVFMKGDFKGNSEIWEKIQPLQEFLRSDFEARKRELMVNRGFILATSGFHGVMIYFDGGAFIHVKILELDVLIGQGVFI
ncbi:hypothetical protein M434DRAFT_393496 [Hypoxylon sp. CO27-5]|nr:hypothetical protein M434DRAFT_393496 [Hypoxylon sp. CO27-5]